MSSKLEFTCLSLIIVVTEICPKHTSLYKTAVSELSIENILGGGKPNILGIKVAQFNV